MLECGLDGVAHYIDSWLWNRVQDYWHQCKITVHLHHKWQMHPGKKCIPCCFYYMNMQYNPSWMTYGVCMVLFFQSQSLWKTLHKPSPHAICYRKWIKIHTSNWSTVCIRPVNGKKWQFIKIVPHQWGSTTMSEKPLLQVTFKLRLFIAHVSLIYRKNHIRKMINNVVHSIVD